MRGHNICFYGEIRKIIFELSSVPPLIWSSEQASFLPASPWIDSKLAIMTLVPICDRLHKPTELNNVVQLNCCVPVVPSTRFMF